MGVWHNIHVVSLTDDFNLLGTLLQFFHGICLHHNRNSHIQKTLIKGGNPV